MKFSQSEGLKGSYSKHYTGLIRVGEVTDKGFLAPLTESLKEKVKAAGRSAHIDHWKEVFTAMGAKPKYQCSLASLYEWYSQKGELYSVNPVVDFYNHYCLYQGVPMGAYDLTKFSGDLHLAEPGKGKMFSPLGNPKNAEPTKDKEVAYFDNDKVVCRYWNLRDSDVTKITDSTTEILFIFDLIEESKDSASTRFEKIKNDFTEFFGSKMRSTGLTGDGIAHEVSLN